MKIIRITVDENLLAKLDADAETKRDGRSAVFRRAVTEYLKNRKGKTIAENYRRGYARKGRSSPNFEGWENEGKWPID